MLLVALVMAGYAMQVVYEFTCDPTADPASRPNITILEPPHSGAAVCTYSVQWSTPLACNPTIVDPALCGGAGGGSVAAKPSEN